MLHRLVPVAAVVVLGASLVRAAEPTHALMTASDGVKIHYMELGRGTPVILIHGYTANSEGKWFKSGIAQALAKTHRLITAIFGGSGVQEVDPKRQAEVPKDEEPPAANAPGATRGETWSSYPGYDRAALDAVQKYPWKPEDRAIDLTTVRIPVLAIVGSLDRPNQRTHRMQREVKNFKRVIIPGETHGSAHFNPVYTRTLVDFISANEKS